VLADSGAAHPDAKLENSKNRGTYRIQWIAANQERRYWRSTSKAMKLPAHPDYEPHRGIAASTGFGGRFLGLRYATAQAQFSATLRACIADTTARLAICI